MSISLKELTSLLLRYGQLPLVYPGAFFKNQHRPKLRQSYRDPGLITSDGFRIKSFLIEMPSQFGARGTLIMFHGNNMEYVELQHVAGPIAKHARLNILSVSYRGYANSEGSPTEKGLRLDAQAGLDFITNHETLSKVPIIVFGVSLGGAVAIDLVSRNPTKVTALIVENTFRSLPQVVRGWPYIGIISFVVSQKWNSAAKIPKIPASIPICMLSGLRDEVVLPSHMNFLWDLVQGRHVHEPCTRRWFWRRRKPRTTGKKALAEELDQPTSKELEEETQTQETLDVFHTFKDGGHCDTSDQTGYSKCIQDFVNNVLKRPLSKLS